MTISKENKSRVIDRMEVLLINLQEVLLEALRRREDYKEDRVDYSLQDYNNFILEIADDMESISARE